MANDNKKFYWIKLRTDFFQEDGPIDFLMSQPNGAQYVVLYQMLCLKTANNGGAFYTTIGEAYLPYDVNKIVRDTKYFDFDTVSVALQLFKKLGLIFENFTDTNFQFLQISDFDRMVGSESANPEAIKKREQRYNQKISKNLGTKCPELVRTENPQEIRDIDNNIYIYNARAREENLPEKEIVNAFEEICGSLTDTKIYLTAKRKQKIDAVLENHSVAEMRRLFALVMECDYLLGKGPNGWRASFDWLLDEDNIAKVLEGNYKNKLQQDNKTRAKPDPDKKPGFKNFSQRDTNMAELEKAMFKT